MGLLVYAHIETVDGGGCQHPLTPVHLIPPLGSSPDFSRQVCRERSALFFSYPPASSIVVAEIRIGETGSLLPR